MKKVLLINPHWKRPGLRDRVRRDSGVAHPGLLQIAEILLKHNKNVSYLELGLDEVMIPEKIKDTLDLECPEIVGITATTCSYPGALEIAQAIKTINPDTFIVGGGIHFALNYMDIFNCKEGKFFDVICTGEGELPMLEIVEFMEGDKKIDSIRGIAYKDKTGDLVVNPQVDPMSIPPVIDEAWSLLDPDLYKFKDKRKYGVAINTMRGCRGKCTFCTEPYRWPSVTCMDHKQIIKQLIIVKERIDPSYVFIGDSNFGYPISRLKKFVKSMREEGLSIPFNCLARLDDIYRYRELLPKLREIGCFLIHYGGERTTDSGQSYLQKGESSSITGEVTKIIQDADIAAKATFIFGLPNDDRDSMKLMIDDIYRINPDIVSFGCYTPIPGTPSFKKDQKFISIKDLTYYTVNHTVCDTLKMSQKDIEEFLDVEWLSFWKSSTHRGRLKHISNPDSLRIINAYHDFIDVH